jgi:hypothetical protein
MTFRAPPRVATWLLRRLGPTYQNESLIGDLYEEYQLNRTQGWYWRQVIVAVCSGRSASVRRFGRRVGIIYDSTRVQRLPTSAATRFCSVALPFCIETAAVVGAIALAEQVRSSCASGRPFDIGWFITLLGGVGLCLSVGLYLSLYRTASPRTYTIHARRIPSIGKSARLKRLIGVFAVTALSAGTLAWASGTSHIPQQCGYTSNAAMTAASNPVHNNVSHQ